LDGDAMIGVPALNWTTGDDLANIQSLIENRSNRSHTMSRKSETPTTTSTPEPSETVLDDAYFSMMVARPGSKAFNEEHLPPATEEPSDLVAASPHLMALLQRGMDSREVERRARGAIRLKEAFSKIPFYAERAERDGPDYWNKFYESRINT
jgi:hypothetical protein